MVRVHVCSLANGTGQLGMVTLWVQCHIDMLHAQLHNSTVHSCVFAQLQAHGMCS